MDMWFRKTKNVCAFEDQDHLINFTSLMMTCLLSIFLPEKQFCYFFGCFPQFCKHIHVLHIYIHAFTHASMRTHT